MLATAKFLFEVSAEFLEGHSAVGTDYQDLLFQRGPEFRCWWRVPHICPINEDLTIICESRGWRCIAIPGETQKQPLLVKCLPRGTDWLQRSHARDRKAALMPPPQPLNVLH